MGDKWDREPMWWKTYDYISGNTYILAEKFPSKGAAMAYAKQCGMAVISQSTEPLTDDQKEILILRELLKGGDNDVACRRDDEVQSQESAHTKRPCTAGRGYGADYMQY